MLYFVIRHSSQSLLETPHCTGILMILYEAPLLSIIISVQYAGCHFCWRLCLRIAFTTPPQATSSIYALHGTYRSDAQGVYWGCLCHRKGIDDYLIDLISLFLCTALYSLVTAYTWNGVTKRDINNL